MKFGVLSFRFGFRLGNIYSIYCSIARIRFLRLPSDKFEIPESHGTTSGAHTVILNRFMTFRYCLFVFWTIRSEKADLIPKWEPHSKTGCSEGTQDEFYLFLCGPYILWMSRDRRNQRFYLFHAWKYDLRFVSCLFRQIFLVSCGWKTISLMGK